MGSASITKSTLVGTKENGRMDKSRAKASFSIALVTVIKAFGTRIYNMVKEFFTMQRVVDTKALGKKGSNMGKDGF